MGVKRLNYIGCTAGLHGEFKHSMTDNDDVNKIDVHGF